MSIILKGKGGRQNGCQEIFRPRDSGCWRRDFVITVFGLEVQQNTNAIKANAIQEFVSGYREHSALYINDPDMARIIQIAQKDIAKLNGEEEQRYFGWAYAGALLGQSVFRQW